MKTLDEVIKRIEIYKNIFDKNGCFECHYHEDDCIDSCFLENVLYYLNTIETTENLYHAEAIETWNRAMGAKDINVPNTNVGNKTAKFKQDGEFLRCGKCNHIVDSGYKYCPNCECRLEFE